VRTVERAGRLAALWVSVIVLLAGAGAAAPAAPAASPVLAGAAHQQPAPYAVGMRQYTFVDPSRPTQPNRTFAGAPTRTLPTMLLYPALGDPSGPAVQGATPVRRRHGFPLVVFSHGFTATGPAYEPLLALFVRAGYVVAAPTFPLSSAGAPGGPLLTDYVNQPGDVSFVMTQVLRLARSDRSLRRTIDRHEIGVAGHSLGAITTLGVAANSCCQDPRIDAAVSLSGIELPFAGGSYFSQPMAPLMLVHGTADGTVPYGASVAAFAQAPAPKVFLSLLQAPHTPFVAPWLDPTVRAITDFLDGYLKHDRRALRRLAGDATVPGVASVQEDIPGCRACAATG
jgi:alpha-beta hydrolase superfamily lysophospholipase